MLPPNYRLFVSFPPHVSVRKSIHTIMYNYLVALIPAVVAALYYFRIGALRVMILGVVSSMVFEALMQRFLHREITISDGSAALTGLLLAMLLPPTAPWWVVVIGCGSAIIIGKQIFGGLGNNPFNATLVGWVILRLSWPDRISSWIEPFGGEIPDPPLSVFKFDGLDSFLDYEFHYLNLFLGSQAGPIGTICVLALLVGGLYLILRRIITWHIPVGLLGGVFIFASILWVFNKDTYLPPLFHLLSGGAVLAAFFIATDPVTSPLRPLPKLIYGIMCGVLIMIIRTWGKYPDGMAFAVLLCNAATPLLNKIRPRPYGKEGSFA